VRKAERAERFLKTHKKNKQEEKRAKKTLAR